MSDTKHSDEGFAVLAGWFAVVVGGLALVPATVAVQHDLPSTVTKVLIAMGVAIAATASALCIYVSRKPYARLYPRGRDRHLGQAVGDRLV
jgi:hypothetical protein